MNLRRGIWILILFFPLGVYGQSQVSVPRPELILPSGHLMGVSAVSYAADGKFILTGSYDATVRSWLTDGTELNTYRGPVSPVSVLKFSPDGTKFAAGHHNGEIAIWDFKSGQLIRTLKLHRDTITGIDFFSNEKILSGSRDRTAKIYNLKTNRVESTLSEKKKQIRSVAYYPQGDFILTGGGGLPVADQTTTEEDPSVKLWSLGGKIERGLGATFLGSHEAVHSLFFTSDGKTAISASDYRVRVYSLTVSGNKGQRSFGPSSAFASISKDEKTLLVGRYNALELFDIASGKSIRKFKDLGYEFIAADLSPDGTQVLLGTSQNVAIVIDVLSGDLITTLKGRSSSVLTVKFSPYGKYLVTGGRDATAKLWDIENGELIRVIDQFKNSVVSVSFSPDNKKIAIGTYDHTGKVVDLQTGEVLYPFNGGSSTVTFSPDGRYLAAVNRTVINPFGSMLGNFVKISSAFLYDAETGKFISDLTKGSLLSNSVNRTYTCAIFSPDSKLIYIGGKEEYPSARNPKVNVSYGRVDIWDIEKGKTAGRFSESHEDIVTDIALSPDGKTLVTASDQKSIALWNRTLGRQISVFNIHHSKISTVEFSPNGKQILSAGFDKKAILFDVEQKKTYSFLGHTAELYGARFSPADQYIVTSSYDNTTKIWSTLTGKELATLYPIDLKDWLIITPQGYFDGSPGALSSLYYNYQSHIIPLEQLKPLYYKKGLLPILLGYQQGTLPQAELFSVKHFYPSVKLSEEINPKNPVLLIQATNLGGGIGKINVKINGQTAYEDAGTLLKEKITENTPAIQLALPLSNLKGLKWGAQNVIEVSIANKANTLKSPTNKLTFGLSAKIN